MGMRESTSPRAPRFVILATVAALHAALIALILSTGVRLGISAQSAQPLELVYIPKVIPPSVRADTGRPPRMRTDIALAPVPPMIASSPASPSSSGSGSRGSGVDWLAEAHRAVKAYEIRRDQPSDHALSGKSPANDWWPQQGAHAGDEYKNEAGDWIVWIDADCYKVAGWHSADPASNAGPAQIICPKKTGAKPASP